MTVLVVGCDYSTYEASLVSLPLDGPISRVRKLSVPFRKPSQSGEDAAIAALGGVRAALLDGLLGLGVSVYDGVGEDRAVVWVERGYGQSRRADWILGAYFGAIYSACVEYGLVVNASEAREWKRIVTAASGVGMVKDGTRGNGNAKKEVANEACRALLALGEVDGSGWTPDELDGFGISYAGRCLNLLAVAS